MEGGTLTEAVKGHEFKEPQIAYVAKEVRFTHVSVFMNTDVERTQVFA